MNLGVRSATRVASSADKVPSACENQLRAASSPVCRSMVQQRQMSEAERTGITDNGPLNVLVIGPEAAL